MKLIKENKTKWEGVSHNPDILKKVFIKKGEISKLMTFGEAVFQPGQKVDEHLHKTAYEVFYILEGKAEFTVEGKNITAFEGDCIIVEPGELHSQNNPFKKKVVWIYFVLATDR